FFPFSNVSQAVDIETRAGLVLAGLTVGVTGVVNPAGVIASLPTINDLSAAEREKEGVIRVVRAVGGQLVSFFRRDASTPVFDDAGFFRNVAGGKHPFPMQGGRSHDMPSGNFATCHGQGLSTDKSTTLYAISKRTDQRVHCELHRKHRARSARWRTTH